MSNMTISIPDERWQLLQEMSEQLSITPEELVSISIENLLKQPEDIFRQAVDYVLNKNTELYNRLA
ncbi:MAG: DNA-binding protein [Deltaproteobacteria bacterium]|nr:DNA-binding protein [Deltaproteobacteria bacterium]MBF0524114.1 DNA-binding protein [Deltaproteobacteria bacterium]